MIYQKRPYSQGKAILSSLQKSRECNISLPFYNLTVNQFVLSACSSARPAHGVTDFQFFGDARHLHHTGQYGVHALLLSKWLIFFSKALLFHPWCVSCDSHEAQAQEKKGGNNNENRKNHSETEGRGSGLPYGKRRGRKSSGIKTLRYRRYSRKSIQ